MTAQHLSIQCCCHECVILGWTNVTVHIPQFFLALFHQIVIHLTILNIHVTLLQTALKLRFLINTVDPKEAMLQSGSAMVQILASFFLAVANVVTSLSPGFNCWWGCYLPAPVSAPAQVHRFPSQPSVTSLHREASHLPSLPSKALSLIFRSSLFSFGSFLVCGPLPVLATGLFPGLHVLRFRELGF